jgi:hypothetical protein
MPAPQAAPIVEEPVETPDIRSFLATESAAPQEDTISPIEARAPEAPAPSAQVSIVQSRDIQAILSPSVAQDDSAHNTETHLTPFSDLKAAMNREVIGTAPAPAAKAEPLAEDILEEMVPVSEPVANAGFATFSSRRAVPDAVTEDEALETLMSAADLVEVAPVSEPIAQAHIEAIPEPADMTTTLVADMVEQTLPEQTATPSGLQRIESVSDIMVEAPSEPALEPVGGAIQTKITDLLEAELAEKLGADVANAVKLLIQQEVRAAAERS